MLAFSTEIDGIVVNGIDLIRWNADGQIIDLALLLALPLTLLTTRALSVSALSGRLARGPFWLR